MNRRRFLRAAGVSMALPLLDSLPGRAATAPGKAIVALCTTFGLHGPDFIPATAGSGFALSPLLQPLASVKDHFTAISGLSHPGVDGGHDSEKSFLTAAVHPASPAFRNSVSFDQIIAERAAGATRFPFLALSTGSNGGSLSVTRTGVTLPGERSPSRLYAKLFLAGSAKEMQGQVERLREGRSVLDAVREPTKSLERKLGIQDRQTLDEYLAAVRELETRLGQSEAWTARPKPTVAVPPPTDVADVGDTPGRLKLMLDLVHLALQTDSTRVVTLQVQCNGNVPPVPGVSMDHHNLSHHGKDPDKLKQLHAVELAMMTALGSFLSKLHGTSEGGTTLLNRSAVLFGSNLGNASTHDTKNMPILVAGGGFRHGQHLAFDPTNPPPLANIFVSLLQQAGVPADRFASGTGTLRGLMPTV